MHGLLPEDEAADWVRANKGGKGAAAGTPVKRPVSGAKRPACKCTVLSSPCAFLAIQISQVQQLPRGVCRTGVRTVIVQRHSKEQTLLWC